MLPVIFSHHDFVLYSYPLMVGIAWGLSFRLSERLLEYYPNPISKKSLTLFFVGCFSVAWLGAKACFLLVNQQYIGIATKGTFWLGGGFVFYGGAIAVFLYILLYCHLLKLFPKDALPYLAPAIAISHGVGRIGCLLAGCCYGVQCELFPFANSVFDHRFPVQLLESLLLFCLGGLLWKRIARAKIENTLSIYIGSYAIIRFFLEFLRADLNRGIYFELSTSQWISLFIIVSVLALRLLRLFNRR